MKTFYEDIKWQACIFWTCNCYKTRIEWKINSLIRRKKNRDILWYEFRIAIRYKFFVYCDIPIYRYIVTPLVHRVHTRLMGRLHVKFHEDMCKGEAVMRLKPFYLTAQSLHCDLDLWPFDPKVHRAHTWLMGRLHVKFHEDRCKGEAFMRLKPFYLTARLQTDGQTDGQTDRRTDRVIPVYPPNFVAGSIIIIKEI